MKNIEIAKAYYGACAKKDLAGMAIFLDPDVHFLSPLMEFRGKERVLESLKGFHAMFNKLTMSFAADSENQVMVVIYLDCPEPIGLLRTAVLLTIKEGLITKLEFFFDASKIATKKDEIFS